MNEWVVNLFLYVDTKSGARLIRQVGASWHQARGTDAEKMARLQSLVNEDHKTAQRYPLPSWCVVVDASGRVHRSLLTYETFLQLTGTAHLDRFWEDAVFQTCAHAPRNPLMVVTPIVDGEPRVDIRVDMEGNPTE